MARTKIFALKRPYPRQSWNKHAIYNYFRYRQPSSTGRTFYQQKFRAKQETRRYHGEYLTERKWNSMFRHTLRGVVRMNPADMARSDGSHAVSGRGSGLDVMPKRVVEMKRAKGEMVAEGERKDEAIPFAQMTFAPLERRLDTAVYRALFASSIRQARMMCLHGNVAVNGVKMPHAGYLLNPGDMFSVDPLLVMQNIGELGRKAFKRLSTQAKVDLQKAIETAQSKTKSTAFLKLSDKKVLPGNADAEFDDGKVETKAAKEKKEETSSEETKDEGVTKATSETTETKEVEKKEAAEEGTVAKKQFHLPSDWRTYLPKHPRWKIYDEWKPKRFMNLFAYIPRYLEVNHHICHAVYLRHPVARSGGAEVPNPFNNEIMQLAYNWYLRRR